MGVFSPKLMTSSYMSLLFFALISAFVGEWADASIIALVVVLNAVIGVVQESKAEQALEALKRWQHLKLSSRDMVN